MSTCSCVISDNTIYQKSVDQISYQAVRERNDFYEVYEIWTRSLFIGEIQDGASLL